MIVNNRSASDLAVDCLVAFHQFEVIKTLKIRRGFEGIQQACPCSCLLLACLTEQTHLFYERVLKLTDGIELAQCACQEVE